MRIRPHRPSSLSRPSGPRAAPMAWLLTLCLVLAGLLPLLHSMPAGAVGDIPAMPLCTTSASGNSTQLNNKQQSSPDRKSILSDCGRLCGAGLADIPALPAGFKWPDSRPARYYAVARAATTAPAWRLYADAQPRAPPMGAGHQ